MSETAPRRIRLVQGNRTIRGLMKEALVDNGFEVDDALDAGDPSADEAADLLVVDADSGIADVSQWRDTYAAEDRPVLICGLKHSREAFADAAWLSRPFSPTGLVAECRNLLGLTDSSSGADDEAGEPARRSQKQFPGLHEDSTPETQKLSLEDAEKLEAELGLEKGALSGPSEAEDDLSLELGDAAEPDADDVADAADEVSEVSASVVDTDNLSPEEGAQFLEIDTSSSIVLDVDDLEDVHEELGQGGSLVGGVSRERVDTEEFEEPEPVLDAPEPLRSPTLSQTMPDAPAVMAPEEVVEDSAADADFPEPPRDEAPSSHGSVVQLPPQVEHNLDNVSRLLAESWGRIGLASRTRDRADHIRKVLRAIFTDGLSASAAEIERIPGALGFSGTLAVLGVADLVRTVAERGLRGRLELSVGQDDVVLYLDGAVVDGVENLSGNDDAELLEALVDLGYLDAEIHEELVDSLTDEMAPPLQMRLREDQLVSPEALREARRERARRLLDELHAHARGTFAFMEVTSATGHAWPVDGLDLEVDTLFEGAGREDSKVHTAPTRPALGATDIPAGLEVDEHLPQTVEVPDPDEEP